jgi:putative Mn2+ efflux pump MntP
MDVSDVKIVKGSNLLDTAVKALTMGAFVFLGAIIGHFIVGAISQFLPVVAEWADMALILIGSAGAVMLHSAFGGVAAAVFAGMALYGGYKTIQKFATPLAEQVGLPASIL